ncbi:hypothetical protein [Phytomonospora endophytica]|uniref:Uncharacterized protein n=1 Tax=Phytomonospora endophytica TaxID=714109 RepID=A0A841FJV9_9ACTN|nr:hypothetical protein [Phytomonospora endophytica]MBB6036164.1 hypothetical protein [Phytomonospora endophytica]GIG67068.1 hypothetical protein Pen01_33630 [Phytomonospora endophytica]
MPDEKKPADDSTVDRRRMLRRAGAVMAGVAGATVAGAATATPAAAAPGEAVLQGAANDAKTAATSLTTAKADDAALTLANTGTNGASGGPSLALAPSTATVMSENAPAGSMMLGANGMTMIAPPDGAGGALPNHYLYDSFNSTFTVPVNVFRTVDSRVEKGNRRRLFGASSSSFDSAGRLKAGKTVHLDIGDLVSFSLGAFVNVVTFGQLDGGFITVWPYGTPRPVPASVQFYKGVSVRNTTLTPVGYDDVRTDALSIYVTATTHFTIDILGVVINHWASLSGSPMSATAAPAEAKAATEGESLAARRQAAFGEKIAEWSRQRG